MFGIGWPELLVIFCVVVIFVRPRDLPKLFRRIGKLYGGIRRAYEELASAKDTLVRDIEKAAEGEDAADDEAAAKEPPVPPRKKKGAGRQP